MNLPIGFVTTVLESDVEIPRCTDVPMLLEYEYCDLRWPMKWYYKSLYALSAAQIVFSKFPNAEVDLGVVSRSLSQAAWAQSLYREPGVVIDRASAVACICMFESGELNLKPEGLDHILAVSCSNNIYTSEILFSDPLKDSPAHTFRHVVGNVGKPGVVLLFSPRNTIVRKPDLENWDMVNHAPFDGKFEDNFTATSLHLSLIGYEQPVNTDDRGDRDSVVHFVEVVVSVHDRGVWHADLDLLRLANRKWDRILPADCKHTETQIADASRLASCTSIDN